MYTDKLKSALLVELFDKILFSDSLENETKCLDKTTVIFKQHFLIWTLIGDNMSKKTTFFI